MLFFVNLIGSVLALLACIVSGQFFQAIAFCIEHPMVLVYMVVCSQSYVWHCSSQWSNPIPPPSSSLLLRSITP